MTELSQESHISAHGTSTLLQHCAKELQVKHSWWDSTYMVYENLLIT